VDTAALGLLRSQHGRCPLCRCPLLPGEQPPQTPNEWERWLRTTRKAISSQPIAIPVDGKPDTLRFRLTHRDCQRRHTAADTSPHAQPDRDA
jgi:RNA-directed DNA polymerase